MVTEQQYLTQYYLEFGADDPEALNKYKAMLGPIFKVEATCKEPFSCVSKTWMFTDIIFSSSYTNTTTAVLSRDEDIIKAFGFDYITVFFYKNNPIVLERNGRKVDVQPEQLVFIDNNKPLRLSTTAVNALSFNISRAFLEQFISLNVDLHGLVLKDSPYSDLLVSYMKSLENVAHQILAKDDLAVGKVIGGMVANCLMNVSADQKPETTIHSTLLLSNIKQAIHSQIENGTLGVESLMEAFNVSRASLYRLFEPLGGVIEYINNAKLEHAYKLLADNSSENIRVSVLAYQLGFSHPSAFTRAFKARFGICPKDVRKNMGKDKVIVPWKFDLDLDKYKK